MWKPLILITALAAAGPASGAVTVFGGGLAQACSRAALAGERDLKSEETCTLALETDFQTTHVISDSLEDPKLRLGLRLEDINRALDLGVEEPEKAYFNRALAHEGLDDMKAAYLDYQKALELKPEWEPPKRELARFTVRRAQ